VPVLTVARTDNQRYYDAFAAGYERHRHRGYHALVDALETEVILRYATGADVLEAGCGTGLLLKEIAPRARRAVGLDLSRGMLAKAAERGLDTVHASVTHLPFADASFDVAYSMKVLAHVEDFPRALSEMARVVRPGGHVLIELYNPWSLRYLVKKLKPPSKIADGTNDEAVFTRYDTLDDLAGALPRSLDVVDLRGVRVLTPVSQLHDLPLVGPALGWLERRAADAPGLRRLGGFLIVVCKKKGR